MVLVERVEIDLSTLYKYIPQRPAWDLLQCILGVYKHIEIIAMVGIGVDGSVMVKDFEGIVEKVFKEEYGSLEMLEEKAAAKLARKLKRDEITVVELYNGYEYAIVFVVRARG
jgi:hypothetical protein